MKETKKLILVCGKCRSGHSICEFAKNVWFLYA